MKFYYILLILSVLVFAGSLNSQPPPYNPDCPEDDCIENMTDMPPGPPDIDGHPGMMKERKMERLTKDKIDKIMENISKNHPEFHKKLVNLQENHQKIFEMTLHKLRRFVKNDKKGPENKAGILSILSDEIDLDLLIDEYNSEKDQKKKADIKSGLINKLSAIFDKKEQMKQDVIAKIEKNLVEKKAEAVKRKADKDKIIKEDLDKILKFREKMDKDRDK